MRTSTFSVEQIAQSLRRVESGVAVAEVCRLRHPQYAAPELR